MARTMRQAIIVLILFALIALSMLSSVYAEEKPVYAYGGTILPPDVLAKVFNRTRLPPNTPDLSVYREFAKRFYKTCNVSIDIVALLIYGIEAQYTVPGHWPYYVEYVLLYDPLTGNFMWGFLNASDVIIHFLSAKDPYYSYYALSKNFPPAGFYFWYIKVDEYAWNYNRSLVISVWYTRWNSTHIAYMANTYIHKPDYCPISDNFTWSMLFKGLPQTVTLTHTLPVTITVTETATLTTVLPTTVTTTMPTTITRSVTEALTTTIEKTVTRVETLTATETVERTKTVSYTLTLPVTTTVIETSTTTAVETTTQVVKELDTVSLMIATGLAIAMGVAIGFMVRRR